jgi:hypothetical protein
MDGNDEGRAPPATSQTPGESSPTAPVPPAFVIAIFVVACGVAGLIAYYGFTGQLGSGIP